MYKKILFAIAIVAILATISSKVAASIQDDDDWFATGYAITIEFTQNRSYTSGEWLLPQVNVYADDNVLGTFLYKPLNDDTSQGWMWHVTSYNGDGIGQNDAEIDQLQNTFDWIENGLNEGQQVAPDHDDGLEMLRQVNFAHEFINHVSNTIQSTIYLPTVMAGE